MTMFVPLGALCRTSHQIKFHASALGNDALPPSLPFDWTITSFSALTTVLHPEFDPKSVLTETECSIGFSGAVQCDKTGLIFHHDLPPSLFEPSGGPQPYDKLPEDLARTGPFNDARARFLHTFAHLQGVKAQTDCPIFVRWMSFGHPEKRFPALFAGESPQALYTALLGFMGGLPFRLLVVTTKNVPRDAAKPPALIVSDPDQSNIATCLLYEWRGWNGDGTDDYRGDEESWGQMLRRAIDHWPLA